ncbi:MAG: hypothetical protein AAFN78_09820, partial [Pseudomonadota bacterium]
LALTGSVLTATQVWKLYVFLASCLAALSVPLALSVMQRSRRAIAVAGLFALLLWWISIFRWYHTAGMVSYVLAAYLTVPFAALVYRYVQGYGGPAMLLGLGAFGAAGLFVHPLFPLPVALLTLLFFAFAWERMDLRRVLEVLTVVPAISLAPNLYWLYLYFAAEPLTVTVPGIRHQAVVDWNLLWMELAGIWEGDAHGSRMYILLALAAAVGNVFTRDSANRIVVRVFTAAGVFWIVYAALGASVDALAKFTQPNRFAPLGYLLLTVPAGFGIAGLLAVRGEALAARARYAALAGLGVFALLTAANLNELRRELSWADIGHYGAVPPEVAPAGPMTDFMLEWLARETTTDARVLFETSNARIHDGYHVAGYLAYSADREFIGGAYVFHYFANFTDGFLFGHDIGDLSHEDFAAYAELYNLGWIIAHSEASKARFDAVPWLEASDTFGVLATYRINREHSYFAEGRGRVTARAHSRLELSDLEGDSVVLKYHYMRGLATEPPTALEPVYRGDDPNPFIRIDNPPPELVITFD